MTTHRPQHPRLRRRRALLVSAWGVAAGAATAVGLVSVWWEIGLAIGLCLLTSFFLLALTALWSIRSETGMGGPAILRTTSWSALGLLAATGLCQVLGGYGLLAV